MSSFKYGTLFYLKINLNTDRMTEITTRFFSFYRNMALISWIVKLTVT